MTKRPVFGEMSLKDRIISAQNATDVMLKNLTPVGFDQKTFGKFARGTYFLDNAKNVQAFVTENFSDRYNEAEIATAMTEARNHLGALYRGERLEMPQVYAIDYRPNPANLKLEAKAMNEVRNLVNGENPAIQDEGLKAIINNNIRKFKQIQNEQRVVVSPSQKAKILEEWVKTEQTLTATYPDYDAKASQDLVNETIAGNAAPEKVQINLNEPQVQVVPPVEQPSVVIEAPKAEM
jgi:hypothetical protein